jgi:aspartate carbamoyltransferase catalytic subunit
MWWRIRRSPAPRSEPASLRRSARLRSRPPQCAGRAILRPVRLVQRTSLRPEARAARDFLAIEGLPLGELRALLARAEELLPVAVGDARGERTLEGRVVANIFFEDSTRTRVSFEIAADRLGAAVVNLGASGSSASKGETLVDTARNIDAMGVDAIVVRTSISGGAALVAQHVGCPVINAGDGRHEHPTQALLDVLALRLRLGALDGRRIAIVGDIANSRVARSATHALVALGAHVHIVGPPSLVPVGFEQIASGAGSISITHDLDSIIHDLDAIMMLRIQMERAAASGIAPDYRTAYGLTVARRARLRVGAVVLHPGPVNRGLEIDDEVADDPGSSVILAQVSCGVAARMAVLLRAMPS